jgi:hypothetical protein
MDIEIYKENSSEKGLETEFLKIVSFKKIIKPKSLLFFKDGTLSLEDNSEIPMYEVKKVQFIASCKTKFSEEILVAFYLGEYSGLCGYVMSELPRGYFSPQGHLIDYKSYSEICKLTSEKKMSLSEYYQSVKGGHCDPNSFVIYKEKYLNSDENKVVV